jgi:hypothetical protein
VRRFHAFQKSPAGNSNEHRKEVIQRRAFLFGYKLLMSGNQSFNQSLYVPLTRTSLICTRKFTF